MVNFIYLAHSQERYLRQTVFSILSYQQFLKTSNLEHRIIVFTDNPDFFKPLGVITHLVSESQKVEWKGAINFIHRMKIMVMIEAKEKHEGKLLFIDSDNYAIHDPTDFLHAWNEDKVIMEKLEYVLQKPADLVGKKYKRFFKKSSVFGQPNYSVDMNQQCWNSGIIGIPGSGKKLLPEILSVCDDMHSKFQKHLSEQMAFSIVLGKHYEVQAFKPFTFHWFGRGQAINRTIDRVLVDYPNGNADVWITAVFEVKNETINAELNPDKQPWYKRWFAS